MVNQSAWITPLYILRGRDDIVWIEMKQARMLTSAAAFVLRLDWEERMVFVSYTVDYVMLQAPIRLQNAVHDC